MTVRIGINGFGRIGKNLLRARRLDPAFQELEIVAINDLSSPRTVAHLLRYDSVLGRFDGSLEERDGLLVVDGREIAVTCEAEPAAIPWRRLGVDLVVEATGHFAHLQGAEAHLQAGGRRVVITAPAGPEGKTLVMGLNEEEYDPMVHRVVSNASCTTNCLAHLVRVLHERFVIRQGFMTTVHAYTNGQHLLDFPDRDLRRARAAGLSMIPTTTGAGVALGLVMPEMQGRIETLSIRVPTPNVSLVDLVVEVEQATTTDEVNAALRQACNRYLGYTEEPLVSVDLQGDPRSCVVDAACTRARGHSIKVVGWYDNEWAYACRVLDLMLHMASREVQP